MNQFLLSSIKGLAFICLSATLMLVKQPAVAKEATAVRPGVVYHISDEAQASRALLQIANQMRAMPGTPVRVVGIGTGIRFMLDGGKDRHGNAYVAQMESLMVNGVEFFACENTMNAFEVAVDDLALGVGTVPSGIAAIAELQLEQGYAYIKP